MTVEEAEAPGEVVAGKVLVHSILILLLFDSGASHCFISSRFIALHSIPLVCMNDKWEISTKNWVITTNKICKACIMELLNRKLENDMFVLNTGRYSVFLGITCLSKYHVVIDYQNKKVIFRISHQPEFQFIGEHKSTRKKNQLDCATADVKKKGTLVCNEFPSVSEEITGLSPHGAI